MTRISEMLAALHSLMGGTGKEKMKLKGSFKATIKHADGSVETRRKDNLILDVGFDFIADAIGATEGNRPTQMCYTALGTGEEDVAESQTKLAVELERKAATYAHTAGTKTFTFTSYFMAGEATGAITEAGICNAPSEGIFLDRVKFAVINKDEEDELTTNFEFTMD